jgi:hypothetical protein
MLSFVLAYRDALRLFLSFVAAERGRSLTRINVEDFTAERVRHFLGHVETCRGLRLEGCQSRPQPLGQARCAIVVAHVIKSVGHCVLALAYPDKVMALPARGRS